MKYLAAYALCNLSGKAPTKDAVKAVLKAAGVAVDEARINDLFTNFDGKDFAKTVAAGLTKVAGAGGASAGAAAPKAEAAKADAKKPEVKAAAKPAEEDADADGGMLDLFG